MSDALDVEITCRIHGSDGVTSYKLGTGQIDLTGSPTALAAMRQLPEILRDLADQMDEALDPTSDWPQ